MQRPKDPLCFHSLCLVRHSVTGKAQLEHLSQFSKSKQSQGEEVLSHRCVYSSRLLSQDYGGSPAMANIKSGRKGGELPFHSLELET